MPLLTLLLEDEQLIHRLELSLLSGRHGVGLHYIAHAMIFPLLHYCSPIHITFRISRSIILSEDHVYFWRVIDGTLSTSNLLSTRIVQKVSFDRDLLDLGEESALVTQYQCMNDVLLQKLPMCMQIGMIVSLCEKQDCGLHHRVKGQYLVSYELDLGF